MRRIAHIVAAGFLFVSFAGTAAHAVKHTSKKSTKTASMKCPNCGMKMSTKKTAATPRMMKVNGKTYYCCSACSKTKAAGTKKQPG
jgi:YHS domain-containing protein